MPISRPPLLVGTLAGALSLAACGDDTGPPDARVIDGPPAGGTVSLSWSIGDDGAPLTCEQVGATVVTLALVPDDQPFGTTDVLACGAAEGASRALSPGVYDVTVSLGGVAADPVRFDDVVVTTGQDTALGHAMFQVEALGGFAFRIVAGGQGNCTAPAQGGAGITAMQLELAALGGGCVPATFEIAAGATQPASTYETSCAAPAPHACIAHDQQITARPTITTGTYRMTITGLVDGVPCWSRLAQFAVPAGERIANLPQQDLTRDDANPACAP